MEKMIAMGFVLILTTFIFYLLLNAFQKKRKIDSRIKDYIPQKVIVVEDHHTKKTSIFKSLIKIFSRAFSGLQFSAKTEQLLLQAGSKMKLEEYFALRLVCAFVIVFLTFFLGLPLYICFLIMPIGFAIPNLYMKRKATKRIKALTYQLVETLATMSNSMRAGFSFLQSMQLIGKEMPDPIGPEFDRAVREIGMGIPMEEVFEQLLIRLPSKELDVVTQSILEQRKSGGNLALLLETSEETIRGRIRILEELKTLTAQGILSSWIITGLPIGLAFYLNFINPDFFGVMFEYKLGLALLSVGALSLLIGWLLIRKIVRIEV